MTARHHHNGGIDNPVVTGFFLFCSKCCSVHLMVDLETIIALATMTYIGESNVYELHPGDEKVFNDFADES